MRQLARALFGVLTLSVAACSNPFSSGDCVSLGVYGIQATVTDGTTHQAPSSSPTLLIVDGSYQELVTLTVSSNLPQLAAALERPGNYRVVVKASGYQDYTQENVAVTRAGACNYLQGVHLNVQLSR